MPRNKFVDQLLLLLVGVAMSIGLYLFWCLVELRTVSYRLTFFIVFNVLVFLTITWRGVSLFQRHRGFWIFYSKWAVAHIVIYGIWGYWGNRIELCAFTLPFEAYWFFRIAVTKSYRPVERRSGSE